MNRNPGDTNFNLKSLASDFYDYMIIEKSLSPLTVKEYRHYIDRFLLWLENNKYPLLPDSINVDTVRKFRIFLASFRTKRGNTLNKSTQSYHVVAIRSFIRYMTIKRDIQLLNPDKIDLPKTTPRMINFLNRDQLNRLLESPDTTNVIGIRDRAILETLFSTGLRVSELVKLNRDQVNLERREFAVRGKGNKVRLVFLSDTAADWILRYLSIRKDGYPPLFIRYGGPKSNDRSGEKLRLTARSVERLVNSYSKKSGLPFCVHPHTLRHSFATDLLIHGADLRSVQELLGHESIRTTQIYTHVTDSHLKEVFEKYHSRK
jgi:site-specific recombinase XerD